jgi:serine/threonine-protein kinase RsbW
VSENDPRPRLRLEFPSDSRYLAEIHNSARTLAETCRFPKLDSEKIALAVEECVANAIEHAYGGRTDGSVEIEAAVEDQLLRIDIVDRGGEFQDPGEPPGGVTALAAAKQRGGLGLVLVRRIADSVDHLRDGDRNICRLTKRLPEPPRS